jgi:hypothetical protein
LHQDVNASPHTTYQLSAWLKTSGDVTTGKLGVRDQSGKILAELPFSKLGVYTRQQLAVTSGDKSLLQVFAGYDAPGHDSWLQLDDFSLTAGP